MRFGDLHLTLAYYWWCTQESANPNVKVLWQDGHKGAENVTDHYFMLLGKPASLNANWKHERHLQRMFHLSQSFITLFGTLMFQHNASLVMGLYVHERRCECDISQNKTLQYRRKKEEETNKQTNKQNKNEKKKKKQKA